MVWILNLSLLFHRFNIVGSLILPFHELFISVHKPSY
uniref:Uncharacterized protein n=1 Tax=Rhizophora mucronata TaxID=61149 RepID=A0A2P2QKQ6_RHIMU